MFSTRPVTALCDPTVLPFWDCSAPSTCTRATCLWSLQRALQSFLQPFSLRPSVRKIIFSHFLDCLDKLLAHLSLFSLTLYRSGLAHFGERCPSLARAQQPLLYSLYILFHFSLQMMMMASSELTMIKESNCRLIRTACCDAS